MAYRKLKLKDRLSVYPISHPECDAKARFLYKRAETFFRIEEFVKLVKIASNNEEFSHLEYIRAFNFALGRLDMLSKESFDNGVYIAIEVVKYEK